VGLGHAAALGNPDGLGRLDGRRVAHLVVDGGALGAVAAAGLGGTLVVTVSVALLPKKNKNEFVTDFTNLLG
jgi:hypothetical protein